MTSLQPSGGHVGRIPIKTFPLRLLAEKINVALLAASDQNGDVSDMVLHLADADQAAKSGDLAMARQCLTQAQRRLDVVRQRIADAIEESR